MEQESYASYSNIPTYNKYSLLRKLGDIKETLTTMDTTRPKVSTTVRKRNLPQGATLETVIEEEEEKDSNGPENGTNSRGSSSGGDSAHEEESREDESVLEPGEDLEDSAPSQDCEEQDEVNIISMRTDSLWIIDAVISGRSWSTPGNALVDTGASNNLIAKRLVDGKGEVDEGQIRDIGGIGSSEVQTIGRISLTLDLPGMRFQEVEFEVMKDEDMKYGMILGVALFVSEGLIVDFQKRRLSKHRKDGSRLDVYFRDQSGGV